MAPLILDEARAARKEARRVCTDSGQLRLVARSNTRLVETRMARAAAAMAVTRQRLAIPVASPWSGLAWLREDESLERILVPLD